MSRLADRFWKTKATELTGEFREFEAIDFKADIVKTVNSEPNSLSLTMFNLSKESRDWMTKPGLILELTAGYKARDLQGVVFKGQIETVKSKRSGTEWETEFAGFDGAKTTRNAEIEKTFAAGTANKAIMNELVKVLTTAPNDKTVALTRGNIDLSKVSGSINKARTLKGLAIDYYTEFCSSFNLRPQIIDGTLHTVGSNLSISNEIILLDSDSGLLGVPERTETGWLFKSLLRYDMQPGHRVQVKSEVLKSEILMTSIKHTADTTGEWITEIEGIVI